MARWIVSLGAALALSATVTGCVAGGGTGGGGGC